LIIRFGKAILGIQQLSRLDAETCTDRAS
jgi:hypothetical protein